MSRDRIPFGGLSSQFDDVLIPVSGATDASDCVLDDGTIKGRSGYRKVAASAVGSGTAQFIGRHRHGPLNTPGYDAHNVIVVNGVAYSVEDPSTETATDGAIATLGTLDATSGALISGAPHGKNLYLASDTDGVAWARVKPYTAGSPPHAPAYETLKYLPKGDKPTKGTGLTAVTKVYSSDYSTGITASTGCAVSAVSGKTSWYQVTRSGGACVANDYATVDTGGSGADWRDYGMVVFIVSPPSYSEGAGKIDIQIGNNAGSYVTVGTTLDGVSGEAGSPSLLYVNLVGVASSILQTARYVRFTVSSGTGVFGFYGHVLVPTKPGTGTITYRTTFYDSGTEQESVPTETLDITMTAPDTFPTVDMAWRDGGNWQYSASQVSIKPTSLPKGRNGNIDAGLTTPSNDDFAGAPQITQAIPSAVQAAGACRLWRLVPGGYRLVEEKTWATTTTTLTFNDSFGDRVLANKSYKAQGTPPRCSAMASRAGRIIASYDNRLWISSFIPPSTTSDPYPIFPALALEDSDGWAFDVSPAKTEQIACLVDGDAFYVLTNEACYSMPDIKPGSPCYTVVRRGVIGRRAAIFAEDRLLWASADGLYTAANRSSWDEMSQSVRRTWIDWLAPDSGTVLLYQDRKLYVAKPGSSTTRFMRFDFVTGTWVRGTWAHKLVCAASFTDSGAVEGRAFFVASNLYPYRLQKAMALDDTSAIPDWTYSTGYLRTDVKAILGRVLILAYGALGVAPNEHRVTLTARKSGVSSSYRTITIDPATTDVESELPMPADLGSWKWMFTLTAHNTLTVKTLETDVEPIAQTGG